MRSFWIVRYIKIGGFNLVFMATKILCHFVKFNSKWLKCQIRSFSGGFFFNVHLIILETNNL